MGGVDQIGNMRTGHDFISRLTNLQEDTYGMNDPIDRQSISLSSNRCDRTIDHQ